MGTFWEQIGYGLARGIFAALRESGIKVEEIPSWKDLDLARRLRDDPRLRDLPGDPGSRPAAPSSPAGESNSVGSTT